MRRTLLLIAIMASAMAKAHQDGNEPVNLKNTVFTFNKEYTDKYWTHAFKSATNDLTVYSSSGKKLIMKRGDTYNVGRIVNGAYAGYSGIWLEFYDLNGQKHDNHITYYVRFDQLIDMQPAADSLYARQLAEIKKSRSEETWKTIKNVGIFILLVAAGVGLAFLFFPNGVSSPTKTTSTFYGDGRLREGTPDGMGGFIESTTDHKYKRTGASTYKRK